MATESARGPPHGRGRKEGWWEEGAGEAEGEVSGIGLERRGDETQRKADRRECWLGGQCKHRGCA
jgi:hypothetical protein